MKNDAQTQAGSQGENLKNDEQLKDQQIGADSDRDRGGEPSISPDSNAQHENERANRQEDEGRNKKIDYSGDAANDGTTEEGNYGIDESGRTGMPYSGTAEEQLDEDRP